jgi:hypothetical protein
MAGRTRRTRKSTFSQVNTKKIVQDARKPAAFIIGIIGAKGVAKLIDKNQTVEGLIGFEGKKMLKPLAIAALGLAGHQIVRNQDLKNVFLGSATYGGILAVEVATGKPVLNGLQGTENYQALPDYDTAIAALPAKENLDVAREIDRILNSSDEEIQGYEDVNLTAGIEGDDYEEEVDLTSGVEDEPSNIIDFTAGIGSDEFDEELQLTA